MNHIRRFRELKGLTQEDVARETGLTLGTVRRYERGLNHPRLETAFKLAAALGVTIADLFPLEEQAS